jgi:PAS domain S-box-containing protein
LKNSERMTRRWRRESTAFAVASGVFGYAVALAVTMMAIAARVVFEPYLGDSIPYATFFAAVALSALFGGLGPCLLSVALGAVGAWYTVLVPSAHGADNTPQWVGLGIFVLTGLVIAAFSATMRAGRRSAEAAAEELYEQREWFRTTLASIGDAVIVTDGEGRISFMNAIAERLTAWTKADALGHAIAEVFRIVNEVTGKPTADPVSRVLSTGAIAGLANHTVLIGRDGSRRPIDDSAAPVKGRDGRMRGVVIVFRDVSERRQAEHSLRASEQQMRLVADMAPIYIAYLDHAQRYRFVNKAYAERFGLNRDDVIGKDVKDILGEEAYAVAQPHLEAVLAGKTVEFEANVPYRMIGARYVHVAYVPEKDAAGNVQGLVAVITDMTARRQLEEGLKLADRRKDEFLAMLAHELRNPLAPIRNTVQILRRLCTHEPQVERAHDILERQVHHLAALVDDLLDVSRITQGKIAIDRQPVDLKDTVLNAVETARPLIEARRHALEVLLPDHAVPVEGDPVRLTQVTANLLNNAAKYTDEGGRILLSVENRDGLGVIRVKDNGGGISSELLPHVFELFAQADRHYDRSQGGLGIGLTLVKRLVELHGGKVQAFSGGPGKGSEFVVRLSLRAQPAAAPAWQDGGQPRDAGSKRRILVVDDNFDSAETMAVLLDLEGHDTRMIHDGPTALKLAQAFRPEVVLLDIGMPGMDGYAVAARLRELPETRDSVLIAMTGYGQPADRTRSHEAGFDHHLVKPVDVEALRSLIQ